jgi:hypothetical protein
LKLTLLPGQRMELLRPKFSNPDLCLRLLA